MASQVCQPAGAADLQVLGLPSQRPEDWRQRGFRQALEVCVGCGACLEEACSFYLDTGDAPNTPLC